jgi:hypothetical protein
MGPESLAEQLEAAARRLRAGSEDVAGRLDGLAENVRSGRGLRDLGLSAAVDAWFEERAEAASLVSHLGEGGSWQREGTFEDLDRLVEALHASSAQEEIEKLEANRAVLVAMHQAEADPGMAEVYRVTIAANDARLQEMRAGVAELASAAGSESELPGAETGTGAGSGAVETAADSEQGPLDGTVLDGHVAEQEPAAVKEQEMQPSDPPSGTEDELEGQPESAAFGELVEPESVATEQLARIARLVPAPEPQGAARAPRETAVALVPLGKESDRRDCWSGDSGAQSPVGELIGQGRLAEAYWLTRASADTQDRGRALAFAAAAFGLPAGQHAAMTLQINAEANGPLPVAEDRDGYLVVLAAAVRSGLQAGWSLPAVSGFEHLQGLPEAWNSLFQILTQEVQRGVSIQLREELRLGQDDSIDPAVLGERAAGLKHRLRTSTIAYQRGSRVLQTLLKDNGELGHTLDLILAWTIGDATAEQLRDDLGTIYGDGGAEAVDQIIKQTTLRISSPTQRKTKIISTALDQLRGRIGEVVTLLREAVQVAEMPPRGDGKRVGSKLVEALHAARQTAPLPGPGGAAVQLLLDWIGNTGSASPAFSYLASPSTEGLLVLPGLTWQTSAEGEDEPNLAAPDVLTAMLGLLGPADLEQAVAAHLRRGDTQAAGRLVEFASEGRLHNAPVPEPQQLEALRRQIGDATAEWQERAATALGRANALFAQIRLQNLLAPERETLLAGELMNLENTDKGGRFGGFLERVQGLVNELNGEVEEKTRQLREQLVGLDLDPMDVQRIGQLIDDQDVVTAEELLSFARKGERIPEQSAETGQELKEFLAGVGHIEAPKPSGTGVSARWWFDYYAQGQVGHAENEAVTTALEAWEALGRPTERRNAFQKHVASVLRMLGLSTEGLIKLVDTDHRKDWQVMTLNVTAKISDNAPGYVSRLGSRANGVYKVLVIGSDERGSDSLLRHLPESALGANIIIYLQPLGVSGRRRLAKASYQKPQQVIVVDPAVFGWAAAGEARSFRAVQRVTLPWAAYRPYEPFQAGQVSAEVFKGRDDEKSAIMAREGGLFLYGGRQLGKSSLLRQVADSFQAGHGGNQVAVYADLRLAEIGLSRPPEDIWRTLAQQLKGAGVLGQRDSEQIDPVKIADRIRLWLDESPERRILFLADEADAFLNTDARPVDTAGGQSTFRTLAGLMKLMADTERRFKSVFAGLHQVQRYNRLTNSITAHGGEPVLVGPLRSKAAVDLVVEPLAAVGLFFDGPDLVWRILALTNNQANLVQIVCEGLVEQMQSRALSADGGRPRITAADVEKVVASGGIRDKIRDRLRLTVDLEDRYRVLTLILARRSLIEGYAQGFAPQQLQEEAHAVWPEGFPEQNGVEEVRADLIEMAGLGLVLPLQGQSNAFVMGSPNLVNLLGTHDSLKEELETSEFTQKYDYNPRVARRSLVTDAKQVMRMSPLTNEQWHQALSYASSVVAASTALGADLLSRAVKQYVGEGREIVIAQPAQWMKAVTEQTRSRKPHLLFVDLRGIAFSDVQEAVDRLGKYAAGSEEDVKEVPRRRSLIVVDPLIAGSLNVPETSGLLRPQRWNATSLRAWPEQPFVSAQERRNLIEVTGGWPAFVERTIAKYVQGAPREDLFESMRTRMDNLAIARDHLDRIGLPGNRVQQLASWADMFSLKEYLAGQARAVPLDLAVVLDDDLEEAEALLEVLDALGVLDEDGEAPTVDSVTFRALKTVAESLAEGA